MPSTLHTFKFHYCVLSLPLWKPPFPCWDWGVNGAGKEKSLRYWFQPSSTGLMVLGNHLDTWMLSFPSKKLCDSSLPQT